MFQCRRQESGGFRCARQCRACVPRNVQHIVISDGATVGQIIGKQVIVNVGSNSQTNQAVPRTTDNSGQCQEEQPTCNQ